MDISKRREYSYDNMMKLITVYYKGQDRDVQARISSNDEGFSSIKLKEIVSLDGVNKVVEREMTSDKLEEVISTIFAKAGQQVESIINYTNAGSKVLDCGLEHVIQPYEEKKFIISTTEMKKVNMR